MLELDARYYWQGTCRPPNVHRSLFPISHFAYTVYLNIKLENFRLYVNIQHIERLLFSETFSVLFRFAIDIQCLTRHCVCKVQAPIYIAIWYATMPDNKTHVPYKRIHHTKWWLYCQRCIVLYEQSWLATLHVPLSFRLIIYAIIKITIKGTTCTYLFTSLTLSSQKKNKLAVKNFR